MKKMRIYFAFFNRDEVEIIITYTIKWDYCYVIYKKIKDKNLFKS